MRVINFSSKLGGGAGNAALRLHKNLLYNNYQSHLFTPNFTNQKLKIYSLQNFFQLILHKILYKIFNFFIVKKDYYFFNYFFDFKINIKNINKYVKDKPDLIILHSIQNFVSIKNIYELSLYFNTPILWCLYDTGPFTGGCHFNNGCNNYKIECKNCNAINYLYLNNFPSIYLNFKKKYLKNINLTLLPCSNSILRLSEQSSIFNSKKHIYFPVSIDEKIFNLKKNDNYKKNYKINTNKKILLFATPYLNAKRKGLKYLLTTLKNLPANQQNNIFLITLGKLDNTSVFKGIVEHKHFDYINSDKELSKFYNLSDFFLMPAIEEVGNTMLIESLFCGTPFIGFDVGYISELKKYNLGYTAKLYDTKDLSYGIKNFINMNKNDYLKMRENCIYYSNKIYSNHSQIDRLNKVFESVKR